MIPKKIHFCWLSNDPYPEEIQLCINSWKSILPDYEIIRWDAERFDVASIPFVQEACRLKKWAFAADYIRLYALYHEGGIYLDSDVLVKKSLDGFLTHKFFSAVEYHPNSIDQHQMDRMLDKHGKSLHPGTPIVGIGIQAALMGAEAGHAFLRESMKHYEKTHFIGADGKMQNKLIAPSIYAIAAEKFGFQYRDKEQTLEQDMHILSSKTFASSRILADKDSVAVHLCAGSWRDNKPTVGKRRRISRLLQRVFARFRWPRT